MGKLLERIKSVFNNRRQATMSVPNDRRTRRVTIQDADQKMRDAVERLEQTATFRRDDFYDQIERK